MLFSSCFTKARNVIGPYVVFWETSGIRNIQDCYLAVREKPGSFAQPRKKSIIIIFTLNIYKKLIYREKHLILSRSIPARDWTNFKITFVFEFGHYIGNYFIEDNCA